MILKYNIYRKITNYAELLDKNVIPSKINHYYIDNLIKGSEKSTYFEEEGENIESP